MYINILTVRTRRRPLGEPLPFGIVGHEERHGPSRPTIETTAPLSSETKEPEPGPRVRAFGRAKVYLTLPRIHSGGSLSPRSVTGRGRQSWRKGQTVACGGKTLRLIMCGDLRTTTPVSPPTLAYGRSRDFRVTRRNVMVQVPSARHPPMRTQTSLTASRADREGLSSGWRP